MTGPHPLQPVWWAPARLTRANADTLDRLVADWTRGAAMNTRTVCRNGRHLELEDIPGPNDTVERTIVVNARPCDCLTKPIASDVTQGESRQADGTRSGSQPTQSRGKHAGQTHDQVFRR